MKQPQVPEPEQVGFCATHAASLRRLVLSGKMQMADVYRLDKQTKECPDCRLDFAAYLRYEAEERLYNRRN